MKQIRCTTTRFLLPGSYFQFTKKQMSSTRFLLPGSYFQFVKKQMYYFLFLLPGLATTGIVVP